MAQPVLQRSLAPPGRWLRVQRPRPRLDRAGLGAPQASSVTRARERLGTEPLALLFARTAGPLADPQTPGAFWRGYRLSAVDGTCLDVPNTAANQAAFGGPTDGAFPRSA